MPTLDERIRFAALLHAMGFGQKPPSTWRSELDLGKPTVDIRWYPVSSSQSNPRMNARTGEQRPSPRPITQLRAHVSERVRLAKARFEMWGCPPPGVIRYAGHDVSNQPRDEDGRWTKVGGAGEGERVDQIARVRIADGVRSEKPAGNPIVPLPDDGINPAAANTDRMRGVLERFKALHPLQYQYATELRLFEEEPNWENWDRPIRWDGTTLRVRRGTSDFQVLCRIAEGISYCDKYKQWLKSQIDAGAIKVRHETPKLWPSGALGDALQQQERLEEWYQYMEAAGATPEEISHVKWAKGLNDWLGPGGVAETALGAVGTVATALNARRGGDGGPLMLRGRREQSAGMEVTGQGNAQSPPKNSQGAAQLRDTKTGRFVPDPAKPRSPHPEMTDAERVAHWKRLAGDPKSSLTDEEREQVRSRGRGPQRLNKFGEIETMELSHEPIPRRDGGKEVFPRWPADHAEVDSFRYLKKRDKE